MIVSTKGRYALRVMIDLAQNGQKEQWVSLSDIAKRQQISVKYLEAVIAVLNRAGLVRSKMGKNGGYRLVKAPEEYVIGDILRLTEGGLAPVSCLEGETNQCGRADSCLTLPLWQELDRLIGDYLDKITLADVLKGHVRK